MLRYFSCLAVALLVGASLRAGELDAEFGSKSLSGMLRCFFHGVRHIGEFSYRGVLVRPQAIEHQVNR